MIRKAYLYLFISVLFSFLCFSNTHAQPNLPDIHALNQKGMNILSWINPYDGIKSIAVQRSSDSIYNYTTIGYVKNLKKGKQLFLDGHPNPGENWYRLYIIFNSDLTWLSNRVKLWVDSADFQTKVILPPNDSLQKIAHKLVLNNNNIPDASEINPYTYIRSQYVFTNPFTGHINVELPDNTDKTAVYAIKFFDQKNLQVLEIPAVSEHSVIIEKRNFQRKGIYKFELTKNKEILETGYITIY